MELLSPPIGDSIHYDKVLKCIQLGLLCTEENAADRPAMNLVVSVLKSESCSLRAPKQPGFSFVRNGPSGRRSSGYSVSEITMEAR